MDNELTQEDRDQLFDELQWTRKQKERNAARLVMFDELVEALEDIEDNTDCAFARETAQTALGKARAIK